MPRYICIGVAVVLAAFLFSRLIASSDYVEIEDTLKTVTTTNDPGYCDNLMTDRYLEQTTGVPAPYADEFCEQEAQVEGADAVDVSDIEVNGYEATATATFSGGALDGSSIVVRLVRNEGVWMLDRQLRIASLNRPGFERGYREQLLSPDYRFSEKGASCVIAETRRMSDADLSDALLTDNDALAERVVQCDRPAAERLLLANLTDQDPRYPRSLVRCVEARATTLSARALAAVFHDIIGFGELLYGCDRSAVFDTYREQLATAGVEDAVADCVVARLRTESVTDVVAMTYVDEEYARLIEECQT